MYMAGASVTVIDFDDVTGHAFPVYDTVRFTVKVFAEV
jgi:hypothetical protein